MRRSHVLPRTFALVLVAASVACPAHAQEFRRPQSKVITYQSPAAAPAVVGIMGHVRHPGTYQFQRGPTLHELIETAQGLTPTASSMIRIVRGPRVVQRLAYPAGAQEKLLPGDLVIIDCQAIRDGSAPVAAASPGVQLAMVGVIDRPLIVHVRKSEATLEAMIQKLGQKQPAVSVIPPPHFARDQAPYLPDGSVLVFDPRRIDRAELPNDLPKILPCTLEQPEIGAYGVHNALAERPTLTRTMENAPLVAPRAADMVPLPAPDVTGAPARDDRTPATLSSGSPQSLPVSRVPYSKTPENAERLPSLRVSAPSQSSAVDAQDPQWNQVAEAGEAVAEADAEFADAEPNAARSSLSLFQMTAILSCAGLLVAVALVIRASQNRVAVKKSATTEHKEHRQSSRSRAEGSAPHAAIPMPHIALQAILKPEAKIALYQEESVAAESLDTRLDRFTQLMQNELPLVEEPLALRPGLRIKPAGEPQPVWRVDVAASSPHQPHRSTERAPASTPSASAGERQIIDEAHPQAMPAPHHRIGVEAPVGRALRQLQGARS